MNIDDVMGKNKPKQVGRKFTEMELAIMEGGGSIEPEEIDLIREELAKQFEQFVTEEDYMAGHCHVMALALKKLNPSWKIRAHIGWDEEAEEEEEYRVDHVYIVAPDGSAYDCRGRFSNEQELVGPDNTGGVETQFVDYSLDDIKADIASGELKPIAKGDIDNAIKFINNIKKSPSSRGGLAEAISSRVFHYTRAGTAAKILSSGEFELSSTLGASWEQQFAPKGYTYFLSTTRTRFGGYHQSVGSDAVLFELDGNFYNQRYPGKAVDYWNNRNPLQSYHRSHEAEDRIFSKEPAVPAVIIKMDVYISAEAEPQTLARVRKIALLAKQRGIPIGLYTDADAWRLGDERKQADISMLRGQEPSRKNYPSRRYLKRWIELISANKQNQLSKDADRIRYDLMYTYDKESAAKSLDTDLSNARKPDSSDRPDVVKIVRYMHANKLPTVRALVDHLADKWKTIKNERVNENFADGKVKGKSRPGRVKRAGASCNGSVTDLRSKAKKYGGERGKMYHWCANMKSGRSK